MQPILLALDQGTTSTRAILFDAAGHTLALARRPLRQFYPQPGWVEHDPAEIVDSQLTVIREVLRQAADWPAGDRVLSAAGLTNQRETLVVWDRATGVAVHPAIVWQCRRSAAICAALEARGLAGEIRARTGLPLDPYFTGTKLAWLLDAHPELRRRAERGELAAGTIDSWLIWNLSRGSRHVTDPGNASRTMLFNIEKSIWDEELLSLLDIPPALLPQVVPSSGTACALEWAALLPDLACGDRSPPGLWIPDALPLAGIAGDQQAALFGQACFHPGMVKNTYGTGCFLLAQTGRRAIRSAGGLITTVAWDLGDGLSYALEGSVFHAGSAIQWLRDELGLIASAAECDRLAEGTSDNGGVVFIPAFTGMGAPYWRADVRARIDGLTRGTDKARLCRAALEAIAQQSEDVLECLRQDLGKPPAVMRVDGGASVSDWLMAWQADLSDVDVDRPLNTETTAWGAASLAGLAVGVWSGLQELEGLRRSERVFRPAISATERQIRRDFWRAAVQGLIG